MSKSQRDVLQPRSRTVQTLQYSFIWGGNRLKKNNFCHSVRQSKTNKWICYKNLENSKCLIKSAWVSLIENLLSEHPEHHTW